MTTVADLSDHPLKGYFDALDQGDIDACASCFAEDGVYLHPPWNPQTQNRLFAVVGRENIREYLRRRGKQPQHHRILFVAVNGDSCFVEGRGGGAGVHLHDFVSHAIFDADGLITRYVAFVEYPDQDEMVDSSVGFDNSEFKVTEAHSFFTGPSVE